jgi:ribosomal protein S18 acetylase RimI-like enzyme
VRLPLDLDEALAFCARHAVGYLDEPTRRRLLTSLTSDPAGSIVLGDGRGELRLVATVVDVIDDRTAAAELAVLGARPGLAGAAFAGEVLAPARAFARAVGRRKLHVARPTFVDDVDDVDEILARAGFAFAYETFAMQRAGAVVDAAEPAPPCGWRWAPLDDTLVAPAHAALLEMFKGAPSTTLAPLDVFRRGAFLSPPGWHALLDGPTIAGLVRVSASGERGEVRVLGRAPAYRGRGVGPLLVERGLRLLAAAGARAVTLEVAATNERALELYRSFGFELLQRTPTFSALL